MKIEYKASLVILAITFGISLSIDEEDHTRVTEGEREPPPPNSVGWDYQNNRWIEAKTGGSSIKKEPIMSDSDVERIRRDLPPGYYLYTPGNPYKYRTTEEKIEEYIEDNLDELLENQ